MIRKVSTIPSKLRSTSGGIVRSRHRQTRGVGPRVWRKVKRSIYQYTRPSRRLQHRSRASSHRRGANSGPRNGVHVSYALRAISLSYSVVTNSCGAYTRYSAIRGSSRRGGRASKQASNDRYITTRGITSSRKINNVVGLLRRVSRGGQGYRNSSLFPSQSFYRRNEEYDAIRLFSPRDGFVFFS